MKKQSAANNKFLADTKAKFNKPIYKKVLNSVNESGEAAGRAVLNNILKGI